MIKVNLDEKKLFPQLVRNMLVIVGILMLAITISIYCSRYCLKESKYEVSTDKLDAPITIVQLTDIHNQQFGNENKRLISKIRKSNPDIIVITGDMINSENDELSQMKELISKMVDIAPVYISLGNQEIEYMNRTKVNLINEFLNQGAVILNEEYRDIKIKNQKMRIGGIYGYCLPERYHSNEDEVKFLREFEATSYYKILLSHLPYAWCNYGFTNDYDIDLIFTGHVHGGQVIIPFIGGLYDPETGLFPGKLTGMHKYDNTIVISSSGLGSNEEMLPRFNNIPEIVVCELP